MLMYKIDNEYFSLTILEFKKKMKINFILIIIFK
jgi:hypothetical protein